MDHWKPISNDTFKRSSSFLPICHDETDETAAPARRAVLGHLMHKGLAETPETHSWRFDVSENHGTPKSFISIGFSIIFTIHFGGNTPIFGNTHLVCFNNPILSDTHNAPMSGTFTYIWWKKSWYIQVQVNIPYMEQLGYMKILSGQPVINSTQCL